MRLLEINVAQDHRVNVQTISHVKSRRHSLNFFSSDWKSQLDHLLRHQTSLVDLSLAHDSNGVHCHGSALFLAWPLSRGILLVSDPGEAG